MRHRYKWRNMRISHQYMSGLNAMKLHIFLLDVSWERLCLEVGWVTMWSWYESVKHSVELWVWTKEQTSPGEMKKGAGAWRCLKMLVRIITWHAWWWSACQPSAQWVSSSLWRRAGQTKPQHSFATLSTLSSLLRVRLEGLAKLSSQVTSGFQHSINTLRKQKPKVKTFATQSFYSIMSLSILIHVHSIPTLCMYSVCMSLGVHPRGTSWKGGANQTVYWVPWPEGGTSFTHVSSATPLPLSADISVLHGHLITSSFGDGNNAYCAVLRQTAFTDKIFVLFVEDFLSPGPGLGWEKLCGVEDGHWGRRAGKVRPPWNHRECQKLRNALKIPLHLPSWMMCIPIYRAVGSEYFFVQILW